MSIISFRSNELKETGQTMSLVATATQMAIEHNMKVLIIATSFNDKTLENCFWKLDKQKKPIFIDDVIMRPTSIGVDSGVEGLIRGLVSNKTDLEVVKNYSKTVLRDRLDILVSPNTESSQEYDRISENYPEIIKMANRYYDMVFVDITNRMNGRIAKDILEISDVILLNMTQKLQNIEEVMDLRAKDALYKRRNVMLLIGRYDAHSKYNIKNVSRFMKEKNGVLAIPYNTLFFESCSEGKVVDYFLRLKRIDQNDRNYVFMNDVNDVVEAILEKLKEVQAKI